MPVSTFSVQRQALGQRPLDDRQLERAGARRPQLRFGGRAEDDDPRLGLGRPQLEPLGDRRDAERGRALGERDLGDGRGAVPVGIRLDDGPELASPSTVRRRRRFARSASRSIVISERGPAQATAIRAPLGRAGCVSSIGAA